MGNYENIDSDTNTCLHNDPSIGGYTEFIIEGARIDAMDTWNTSQYYTRAN